ncbi:hypothetical protein GOARA_078_00250 [Gordonia araii NBRC 100433]|uniref:PPM-type phosphatase domain-containing protein n=1 Tax=Gordonia araii NBRC 100433 TaxID=1073574 RepID=G7H6V1_9ACTN|nr:hypothetical protein [Gordonia araii]NNG95993.1 hypothetical protein [Gordonia araii NBRC 100433]GAB11576.1 hypothetical protein GOARA_078_00250 [Gordonia araii NBRC 100433]
MLTSDGVHGVVDPEQLLTILARKREADRLADDVAAAVEAAGSPDNFTVVVVDVSGESSAR